MPTANSITENTLFKRMKQTLAQGIEGGAPLTLHRCRFDSRWFNDLGRYYCTDSNNYRTAPWGLTFETLVEYARELGVLKPHETVSE